MSSDVALAEAYTQALYVIEMSGEAVTRRIGAVDAQADAQLRAAGCRQAWWIVTPCNPRSLVLGDAENAARLKRFGGELRERRWSTLPSCNTAVDGGWREPGFCIFDIEADVISALARNYGQAAIVGARLGAAPALRWLDA